MTDVQQQLEELNEGTYGLFARLETNKEFLSEKQYAFMANALYEQYKKAYDLLNLEYSIPYRTNMYTFKQIVRLQVPRTFLGFKNKMAKVITEEIKEDFMAQYTVRYAQLACEQAKAERKQSAQEERQAKLEAKQAKKDAERARKEMKATQRRLKKDAKKRKKKPRKKDKKSK